MEFIVPQFIERETKIVGPFNFKQSIFLGIAGSLALFLYFVIKSFWIFLIVAFFLIGGALLLTFLKFGGSSLPDVLKNFFVFFGRPKIYLWHRKAISPKILKKAPPPKEEAKEESILKVAEKSSLGKLHAILESKTK
jgi:hypothetical protein